MLPSISFKILCVFELRRSAEHHLRAGIHHKERIKEIFFACSTKQVKPSNAFSQKEVGDLMHMSPNEL